MIFVYCCPKTHQSAASLSKEDKQKSNRNLILQITNSGDIMTVYILSIFFYFFTLLHMCLPTVHVRIILMYIFYLTGIAHRDLKPDNILCINKNEVSHMVYTYVCRSFTFSFYHTMKYVRQQNLQQTQGNQKLRENLESRENWTPLGNKKGVRLVEVSALQILFCESLTWNQSVRFQGIMSVIQGCFIKMYSETQKP